VSSEELHSATSLLKYGLVGRFRSPAGLARSPGLLVLGGAEGGTEGADSVAAQFVEEGFATLSLAYFGAPSLPSILEEIPLEYFHRAVDWLREAPRVNDAPVGVVGHSKGAEAALLIGATSRVRAIVAYAPSHVAWQALNWKSPPQSSWSYHGASVPFVRYVRATDRTQREGWRKFYAACLEASAEATRVAEIPIEKSHGGILLVSGGEDGVWPSSEMAGKIIERLRANHFACSYEHLEYPDAGHAIVPKNVSETAKEPWELGMGGTDAANASARADAWSNALRFLRQELG
jgi:uncharacterized protein